jgi:hypothetical protein
MREIYKETLDEYWFRKKHTLTFEEARSIAQLDSPIGIYWKVQVKDYENRIRGTREQENPRHQTGRHPAPATGGKTTT